MSESVRYLANFEDAIMEKPEGWDQLSNSDKLSSPHGRYLLALENAFLREKAAQAVQASFAPPGKLRIVTEEEIMARPSPEWIVPGLVQADGITQLAGAPGIGKSFFCIGLARAVAEGRLFFNRQTSQRKVLYLAGEGAAGFKDRIQAWDTANHSHVQAGNMDYVEEGVNLSDEDSVASLAEWIALRGYGLIVVDTFSQLSGIQNENDAAQTALVYRNIKRLRDANMGAAVLVVHHLNAGATKARGSTVHLGNVDVMAIAKGNSERFSISTVHEQGGKIKDGKAEEWHGFSLAPVLNSAVVVNNGGKADPRPYEAEIIRVLADGEVHTSTEIRQACGIVATTGGEYKAWQRTMSHLAAHDFITKSGSATAPKYSMPPVDFKTGELP